jgi:hypothetical protein
MNCIPLPPFCWIIYLSHGSVKMLLCTVVFWNKKHQLVSNQAAFILEMTNRFRETLCHHHEDVCTCTVSVPSKFLDIWQMWISTECILVIRWNISHKNCEISILMIKKRQSKVNTSSTSHREFQRRKDKTENKGPRNIKQKAVRTTVSHLFRYHQQ